MDYISKVILSVIVAILLSLGFPFLSWSKSRYNSLDNICHDAIKGKCYIQYKIKLYAKENCYNLVEIDHCSDKKRIIEGDIKTVFIVSGNIDFLGETIYIPEECILFFKKGASFSNCELVGNDTRIVSRNQVIFRRGYAFYRGFLKQNTYDYSTSRVNSVLLSGTWSNKEVGSLWTELESNRSDICQASSINNLIVLQDRSIIATIPKGVYYVYDWIRVTSRSIDFNGSVLKSIDFSLVEDLSLPIPDNTIPVPLQSRYGIVGFNAKGRSLSNLTIDGRSSSRNEQPTFGSQCLLTIVTGSDGSSLTNVTLLDAVDCAICTGSIKGISFSNLTINKCGEHGIYTHAYAGVLRFDNCVFDQCGQSSKLFNLSGVSGCIKGAASRDRPFDEMKSLTAVFNNCKFLNSGEFPVATLYSDIPKALFTGCQWDGNVVGYVSNNPMFNEATGQMYEYEFYSCTRPCGRFNSCNTIRRIIDCKEVTNPFEDTYLVQDCEILMSYDDIINKYEGAFSNELNRELVFRNCSFYKDSERGGIRNTIINPRPMRFESCSWYCSKVAKQQEGQSYIQIVDKNGAISSGKSIIFNNCTFRLLGIRLLRCIDTVIQFVGGEYYDSYDCLIVGEKNQPNRVINTEMRRMTNKEINRY